MSRGHQFDQAEAAAAGRKGGASLAQDRKHMARIGHAGGMRKAERLAGVYLPGLRRARLAHALTEAELALRANLSASGVGHLERCERRASPEVLARLAAALAVDEATLTAACEQGCAAASGSEVPELLFGPYRTPSLRQGDQATCLYRDCDVVVTGWTDAPIPWPRCRPLAVPKSHPSLLVDDELARAIRHESALALRHWWGVSVGVVARWRKALGVGRMDSPGSARLIQAAAQKGAEAVRVKTWTAQEREQRRQRAIEQNFGAVSTGCTGPHWTAEELALLGTAPDAEVAARTGRTVEAVRLMRTRRGVAPFRDRRRKAMGEDDFS